MEENFHGFIAKKSSTCRLLLFTYFNGINLKDLLFIFSYFFITFIIFFVFLVYSLTAAIIVIIIFFIFLLFLLTHLKQEEIKVYQFLFLIFKYVIGCQKINPKIIQANIPITSQKHIFKQKNYFLTILKIDNVGLSELNVEQTKFHLQKWELICAKLKIVNFDLCKLALPFHFFIKNKNLKTKIKNNFLSKNNFFLVLYNVNKEELIKIRKTLLSLNDDDCQITKINFEIENYLLNYFGFNFASKRIIFKPNYIKFADDNYLCLKKISTYPYLIYPQLGQVLTTNLNVDLVIKKATLNRNEAIKRVDYSLQNLKANHFFKFSKQISKANCENLLFNLQNKIINHDEFLSLFEIYVIFKAKSKKKLHEICLEYNLKINNFHFYLNNLSFKQHLIIEQPLISLQALTKAQEIANFSFVLLWFFNNSNCIDENKGFLLGKNLLNNAPIIFNQQKQDSKHLNSNLIILGTSGSGKTFNCFNHVLNNLKENIKTIIIDFEHEYLFLHKYTSSFANLNFSDLNFNIFFVFKGSIQNQTQLIIDLFKIYFPNFNLNNHYQLKKLIIKIYLQFQINDDNLKTVSKWPNLEDLYHLVVLKNKKDDTYQDLKKYIWIFKDHFQSKIDSRQFKIDLNKKLTIINLTNLVVVSKKNEVYLYLLLELLNTAINSNFLKKGYLNIIIDEAHLLLNETYQSCLLFFINLMKRIRKYQGFLTLITQNVADLVTNNDKKLALINNCQYLMIHKVNEDDLSAIKKLFLLKHNLSAFSLQKIANFQNRECLLVDNLKIYFLKINLFIK